MLKQRTIPFLKYRFIAYGLSLSLFVIFVAWGLVTKGLNLGVDFVGGQKIIARFEKGVDEGKIRKVLAAYSPMVQQIGEADNHEFIITTKLKEDSAFTTEENMRKDLEAKYPKVRMERGDAVFVLLKGTVDANKVSAALAGLDAEVRKIGDPARSEYLIFKKEPAGKKKKSAYTEDKVENQIRSAFDGTEILNGIAIPAVFDKPADETELNGIAKKYNATLLKTGEEGKSSYVFYKLVVDESDRIKADLDKSFKNVKVMSTENVGPAVGSFLRQSALKLIIVSIILMTIYLAYRFEFRYSVGAMAAVLHDVILSIAYCGFAGIEINISVVAALLTIFGYSVNDTIVIFDRIRENTQIETKISMVDIVNSSITVTMSRTILTSFLTLLSVFALFLLGGEGISDFAQVLLFGMIIGCYSTIYIASPVVLSWEKLMQRIKS